jgi:hypothetical protein
LFISFSPVFDVKALAFLLAIFYTNLFACNKSTYYYTGSQFFFH